jgi:hypothetical protein
VLVIDMTMTDPVFYTRPVSGQKKRAEVPNGHLLPYDCAEEGWRKRIEQLGKGATPKALRRATNNGITPQRMRRFARSVAAIRRRRRPVDT